MTFKIISLREQIRTVADRWYDVYFDKSKRLWRYGEDKKDIYYGLKVLDVETATADDVKKIIGNSSWAEYNPCDECGAVGVPTIEMGKELDYESNTAYLCLDCLNKAAELLKNHKDE
jgi:hypothetical protein